LTALTRERPIPSVHCQPGGPIPLNALRELVGVCRALYVGWTCDDADSLDLEELAEIGLELAHALSLARSTAPDSGGHRSAWARAEAATGRLGLLIAKTSGIQGSARREGAYGSASALHTVAEVPG
jgi:hypothetical protein